SRLTAVTPSCLHRMSLHDALPLSRMAQGIMTGIGFLGAGVIFKEGITVRGLTTAASIWTTAAIGILFGIGFFYPATLATLIALRSEDHTSELQSLTNLVCRLLLEK